jgi:hypothetical protein
VDVFADCTVDTPAGRIDVTGSGRTIALTASGTRTFRRLLEVSPAGRGRREELLRRIRAGLALGDLTVSVRSGRREIARIEPRRGGGLLSRYFGLPGVRLRPAGLLLSLLTNR